MHTICELSLLYLRALDHSKYGIPNLERQLTGSPTLFAQLVALIYRRSDEGVDPPEWGTENENAKDLGTQAYHLLHQAKRIPGTDENGNIDAKKLLAWLSETRTILKTHARADIGDHAIGELLSKCPADPNGLWPCLPVRQAMEKIASQGIVEGMSLGVYNSRGVHWRGEGGDQERDLAAKYRNWAYEVRTSHPFVARFLEGIAERYEHEASWQDTDAQVRRRLRR